MFCITLESDDPFFNLAIEEVLLKKGGEEYLILGINKPSVIIGKHQSPHREINTKFITENNIPVIRRISGGGTVFHDKGNLNFTFIRQSEAGKQVDFRKYTLPVIEFLGSVGVKASFEGKNDIKIDGFKISGNAEHVHRNSVLHHGTILFSTSLANLRNSIRKDKSRYTSKAVDSNPSSVINLNEKLITFANITDFRDNMMNYFLRTIQNTTVYELSPEEVGEAQALAAKKYKTWEWNWAYGPGYTFENSFQINGNIYHLTLLVKDGIIRDCTIEEKGQLLPVAKKLIGCRHMVSDLQNIFCEQEFIRSKEETYNFF
jgi:lipoate---protein ligase